MYAVNYYLKSPSSKDETLIYLFISWNGQRIKISTGLKVLPALWDSGNQACTRNSRLILKYHKSQPGIQDKLMGIQSRLDDFKREVNRFFAERSIAGSMPTKTELKHHIQAYINPAPSKPISSERVIDYLQAFIEEAQTCDRKQANGLNYTEGTIKNYINLLHTLQRFEKGSGISIEWDTIDRAFYYGFMKWQEKMGFSINYRGKHVKDLKSILRNAYEEELHQNTAFQKRWFAVPSERPKKHPLTLEEMYALHDLDLKLGSTDCKARDVFLLACYLGLRISDIKRIRPDHIEEKDGRKYIRITTQKKKKRVAVPISSRLDEILSRYNYTMPRITSQTVNKKIKVLAAEAGIPEKKAKKLSLHVGRHSFATHLVNIGVHSIDGMAMTGHTTERNFLRYVDIKPEQTAERLGQHEFFQ